jgi:PelA/Pel-15E family pectate lyase
MNILCITVLLAISAPLVPGAIIGTNPPASPLTLPRVQLLPADMQPQWRQYLERSDRQAKTDRAFLLKELSEHQLKESFNPPAGRSRRLDLRRSPDWYGQPEALRIASIVVSFQTPSGGWGKNFDMTLHPRAPGEQFGEHNPVKSPAGSASAPLAQMPWDFLGTFDNDATTTQLRFLARVISAMGPEKSALISNAFFHGLDYVFAAQYPNGGWPQVWPLQGGYHDGITYNDSAMTQVLELLRDVAAGTGDLAFVPQLKKELAQQSFLRGVQCILNTQIKVDGRRTVWCQQHDAITLQPASARNYEMPSQTAGESAGILLLLMSISNPTPEVVSSVHAAAAWFEKTMMRDVAFRRVGDEGRQLVAAPGEGPLWPRFAEIGSDRPIFGDRDKTIHDQLNEISLERRQGYSWFGKGPAAALDRYRIWRERHPAGS